MWSTNKIGDLGTNTQFGKRKVHSSAAQETLKHKILFRGDRGDKRAECWAYRGPCFCTILVKTGSIVVKYGFGDVVQQLLQSH